MTEEELTAKYLAKFPTKLREALSEQKHKRRFLNTVRESYVPIRVYRATHRADRLDDDDFISNVAEAERNGKRFRRPLSIGLYAVSVNEDPKAVVKSLAIPNKSRPALGVAVGYMKMEYGPADFIDGKPHHNWYIFEGKEKLLKEEFAMEDLERFQVDEKEEAGNE